MAKAYPYLLILLLAACSGAQAKKPKTWDQKYREMRQYVIKKHVEYAQAAHGVNHAAASCAKGEHDCLDKSLDLWQAALNEFKPTYEYALRAQNYLSRNCVRAAKNGRGPMCSKIRSEELIYGSLALRAKEMIDDHQSAIDGLRKMIEDDRRYKHNETSL